MFLFIILIECNCTNTLQYRYNIALKVLGFKTVDSKTFTQTLNAGRSVGIVPGGIAEMFTCTTNSGNNNGGEEVLVVKSRKGFVKIALQTGAQIIPCYCFGNSKLFHTPHGNGDDNGKGKGAGGLSSSLASLSRSLRMSIILFWGRWGLPVPLRVPLLTVVGRPIQCPQMTEPSPEMVNEYHNIYMRETKRIFEKYKNAYGWKEKQLVFAK